VEHPAAPIALQHVVRAPHAGVVESVNHKEGELVPEKKLLVVLKPLDGGAAAAKQ